MSGGIGKVNREAGIFQRGLKVSENLNLAGSIARANVPAAIVTLRVLLFVAAQRKVRLFKFLGFAGMNHAASEA